MAPKRATPFMPRHSHEYAVRVSQRSGKNGSVVAAECLFCVYFGRESKVGSKRKNTGNIKYFSMPFRADNYRQHHVKQHPQKWEQYQEANDEEKKMFFEENRPVKETLHNHYGAKQVKQRYLINAPIVKVIIGELLWDPDDIDGSTHKNMMSSFIDYVDESEVMEEGEEGGDRFCIEINNPVQFSLAIEYLQAGLSFRQAARVMIGTKERTGLAAIGSCSDYTIAIGS